jgi:filamentous hemagglutinin
MQADLQRAKERLDRDVEDAWKNGYLTDEEYDTFKVSGLLPKGYFTEMTDRRVGFYAVPSAHSGKPLWLQKIHEGIYFNKLQAFAYQYRELYVLYDCSKSGYAILDGYTPGVEIVSRKNTQFSDISVATGIGYIHEMIKKYPKGAKVADVPSSGLQTGCAPDLEGTFAGHKLSGQHVLEVPRQIEPIPQEVLDAADAAGVKIRDVYGNVYN